MRSRLELGEYGIELLGLAVADIERGVRQVWDNIVAFAGVQNRQIHSDSAAGKRKCALQGVELMNQFDGGVAAVLRRHAGMRGGAFDLNVDARGALSTNPQRL